MASLYRRPSQSRDGIFWIAFYHPKTGRLIRRSLNTTQRARAERLRAHVQALCKADSPSAPVLSSALKVLLRDESGVYASTDSGSANSPMGGKSLPGAVFPSLEEKPAMPSIYPRPADAENPVYWVALYHPLTGAQIRKSLETRNREEAARRACRIEALCTMVSTQTIEVPDGILDAIGARDLPLTSTIVAQAPSSPASTPRRCTVEEALRSLLATMLVGNDGGYLANTLCNARALFGSNLVARVDPRKEKPSDGRQAPLREAGIAVVYLDEITSQMLAVFLAKQGWAMDTCRHYKEFIRRLFNHALASGLHLPTNPHAPNPSAGLSSFIDTERDIVVLTPEEEQAQLAAVAKDWRILAGIKIMLGTGL